MRKVRKFQFVIFLNKIADILDGLIERISTLMNIRCR